MRGLVLNQRCKMWESIFYGYNSVPGNGQGHLKTIEEQDATYVEEAQKQFVETMAPLLIGSIPRSVGPWLLSAGGVEGPTAADFVSPNLWATRGPWAGSRTFPRSRRGWTAWMSWRMSYEFSA